jgi:ribulose-5-phosphate 4-epimerase/fuculose-1-phosphate aldolase
MNCEPGFGTSRTPAQEFLIMKTYFGLAGGGALLALACGLSAQNVRTPPAPGEVNAAATRNLRTPPIAGLPDPAQIAELVLANHLLTAEGVLDAYGHVSVRSERDSNHFLLARHLPAGVVTAADIIEYDMDTKPVRDTGAVGYSERFIHGEIYKARPDVKAVIHLHSPDILPYTVTNVPLRPMIHTAGFLPQEMPMFEIRKAGGMTDMLIRSNELGRTLAETLGTKTAALLRGHGAVVVADSLHVVAGRSYYMTINARAETQALALGGGKVTFLDPEEAAKATNQDGYERAWIYWKSKNEKK